MALTKAQKEAAETARRAALTDEERAAEDAAEVVKASADGKTSVAVEHSGGQVRTFSKEVHGTDFKKVAAEFAETNGGTVVK